MKRISIGLVVLFCTAGAVFWYSQARQEHYILHAFEKVQLSSSFYGEGAGIGDLNQDGHPDVVAGPYWYEGPDFERRHAFYEPKEFDPLHYSDNFIIEVDDVSGNGWNDILVIGFPGEGAHWYENPGGGNEYWESHLIHPQVDNESPAFYDLTGDGKLELVSHSDGYLGYAAPDPADPTRPWSFRRISGRQDLGRFTHGFGVGDVNGDGYEDMLMSRGWWENPGPDGDGEAAWTHHPADFGPGGAQMYAYDVDGDGLNDVITTLEAHGWGMAWYRQVHADGEIRFERHLIMGESHEDNPYGVRFSQPHSLALVDMDGNGLKDLVIGKRYWAHGPDGDPEPDAPAVVYWFKLERSTDGSAEFIPYQVDDNSGAGVEVAAGDLTGNGYPDIVTCNKKGAFVFLNRPDTVSRETWSAGQPQLIH